MDKEILNLIETLAFMGLAAIVVIAIMICVYFDAKYGSRNADDEKPNRREVPQARTFEETEGGGMPHTKNESIGTLPSKISADIKHAMKRFFDE